MTVLELAGDIYEFVARDGKLATAHYPLPCPIRCAQSKSEHLVARTCDGLLVIHNTMGKKEATPQSADFSRYFPQMIFLLALGVTGWYQYRKITQKNAERMYEQKAK